MKKQRVTAAAAVLAIGVSAVPFTTAAAADEAYLPLNRNRTEQVYSDQQSSAYASCNDVYYDCWTGEVGSYLAYDLADLPAEKRQSVNLAWYSSAWTNYDYTVLENEKNGYASLSEYKIYANDAVGGSYPEDGWIELAHKTDITTHSGQILLDLSGYNWVKLEVLGIQNGGAQIGLNIDLHDCSTLVDSWLFLGDSITAGGMITFSPEGGTFADLIHGLDTRFYPAAENGGIGGIFSTTGRENIDRWIAAFPGQYVGISYGTNDCWGDQTGAEKYYENTVYMIETVQKAGKTAVVPKIPFSLEPGISANIDSYNAMIDKIYEEYPDVVQGPDFYTYFEANPEGLSADGVHPNADGYVGMRKLWAEEMYEKIYKNRSTEPVVPAERKGDLNNDSAVTTADAVLLAKWLTTESAALANWKNGDMNGDGKLNAADLSFLKAEILSAAEDIIPLPVILD